MNNFIGTCKLNISIDDVNPKSGWRIIGEPTQKYLENLYRDYGVKVTLFIPANHHRDSDIGLSPSWINELKDLKFIEFGAHGLYHDASDSSRWGECEFGELRDEVVISERLQQIQYAWLQTLGRLPDVWKSPGWLTSRPSAKAISSMFNCTVIHSQHNHNLMWGCKTVTASDFFPPNSFPMMDCNMFILSHIHGKHDNVWNENFYRHVDTTIQYLQKNQIPIIHSFIKEF